MLNILNATDKVKQILLHVLSNVVAKKPFLSEFGSAGMIKVSIQRLHIRMDEFSKALIAISPVSYAVGICHAYVS
jgi:hypothetical protein